MREFLGAVLLTTGMAQADIPKVLTNIAPFHSPETQIMGDPGSPWLLLNPTDGDTHHMTQWFGFQHPHSPCSGRSGCPDISTMVAGV